MGIAKTGEGVFILHPVQDQSGGKTPKKIILFFCFALRAAYGELVRRSEFEGKAVVQNVLVGCLCGMAVVPRTANNGHWQK